MYQSKKNFFQRRTKYQGPKINDRIKSLDVQVINSSGENTKAGFSLNSKKEILECINMSGIKVEGLMTMGPNTKNVDQIARSFQKTKKLFDELNELENIKMKTLSMGMSGDYLTAIREGSTSIRVGTAIFGPRA